MNFIQDVEGAYYISPSEGIDEPGRGGINNQFASLAYAVANTPDTDGVLLEPDEFGFPRVSRIYILESGTYTESGIGAVGKSSFEVRADIKGMVTFEGSGETPVLNRDTVVFSRFDGCNFKGSVPVFAENNSYLLNGYMKDVTQYRNRPNIGDTIPFANFIIDNSFIQITNTAIPDPPIPPQEEMFEELYLKNVSVLGGTVLQMYFTSETTGRFGRLKAIDCYFEDSVEIRINNNFPFTRSSFDNCLINSPSSIVTNIQGGSVDIVETNPITEQDPIIQGDRTKDEYFLSRNSPLINLASNGGVLGGIPIGGLVDLSNPISNDNISVGETITIVGGVPLGMITVEILFDRTTESPIFIPNGSLSDSNFPDSTSDGRPTFRARYKTNLSDPYTDFKTFVFGERMFIDSNGDPVFLADDQVSRENVIPIIQIILEFTIRDRGQDFDSTGLISSNNEIVFAEIGQSNMEGRDGDNPLHVVSVGTAFEFDGTNKIHLTNDRGGAQGGSHATYFADRLFTEYGYRAVMVESASGGSGYSASSESQGSNHWGASGSLRNAALTKVNAALANVGTTNPIALFSGGERDAQEIDDQDGSPRTKAEVKADLQSIVDWWLSTYPNSKFIIFQTGHFSSGDTLGFQQVRELQQEIADENGDVSIVTGAADFPEANPSKMDDSLHYNFLGNQLMGQGLADEVINLIA